MEYNPQRHNRRSIRVRGFDYSSEGGYFVTICAYQKKCIFGKIGGEEMKLSMIGKIVKKYWLEIPRHFPNVELDEFIVMPNHIHGVILLWGDEGDRVGARHAVPLPERYGKPVSGSLPTIVRSFKSAVTKGVNEIRRTPGGTLWQRGFYEHIIRDEDDLNRIRQYVSENVLKWLFDKENPERIESDQRM
ncbi:MAG TPA: transposase [Bacteroidota bacterium]